MARMASKVRREFDAEAAVTLRDLADGAESASAAETGVSLNTLKDAYWDNNEVPHGIFLVNVHVSEIELADPTDTYDLYVEVDTSNAFSSPREVARITAVPGPGFYEVPVASINVEQLEPGAEFIRIRLVGTFDDAAGEITYGAWLTWLKA